MAKMDQADLMMHLMQTAVRNSEGFGGTFAVLMGAAMTYCSACGMSTEDIIKAVRFSAADTIKAGEALMAQARAAKEARDA